MNTELILTPAVQAMVDAIKSTEKTWHEIGLPDHPVYPQFKRKLVVSGFNTPDMEGDEDRIYVNVRQYLVLKDSNKVYKRIQMPDWLIHERNAEELIGENGVLKGIRRTTNNDGQVIEEKEEIIKVPSIQYVRFLIKSKAVHLTDIFTRFMVQYLENFQKEINQI